MGGSAGGGGAASSVPTYLQNIHAGLLADYTFDEQHDFPDTSVIEVFNKTRLNNPYVGRHPRDPIAETNEIDSMLQAYRNWAETIDTVDNMSLLSTYSDEAQKDLIESLLPKLKADYRDIGATFSSTYYIAMAKLYSQVSKETDKLKSDLILQNAKNKQAIMPDMYRMYLEAVRMKVVLKDEVSNQETSYREHEAKWEMDMFQPVANFISAISGGAVSPQSKQPSKLSSALGGALSGAAVGMQMAAIPGTQGFAPALIGGGAIVGLLGGLFR